MKGLCSRAALSLVRHHSLFIRTYARTLVRTAMCCRGCRRRPGQKGKNTRAAIARVFAPNRCRFAAAIYPNTRSSRANPGTCSRSSSEAR